MEKIILASNSPRRKELLEQIGIEFVIDVANIDETVEEEDPMTAVKLLSYRKAKAVADRHKGSLVLGADTVVFYDGEILGKPADEQEAFDMLCMLSGRKHEVITGVSLLRQTNEGESRVTFAEKTEVWMYPHHRDVIKKYVESGEPMDKAGAYGIQGRGAVLVERIKGDYNNVVGLPVARVNLELIRLGV